MRGESLAPFSLKVKKHGTHTRCRYEGNRDWETFLEFFTAAKRMPLGINFGTLVGFHTLREYISNHLTSDPTEAEDAMICAGVERAFQEGAYGVSFDFETPQSARISRKLLRGIATIAARYRRVVSLSLGKENRLSEEIALLRALSRETGASIHISDFAGESSLTETEELAAAISRVERRPMHVHINFDFSPFPFEEVPAINFLPPWAREKKCSDLEIIFSIRAHRARIAESLKGVLPRDAIISGFPRNFSILNGISLAEFAKTRKKTLIEGFLSALEMSNFSASLIVPHSFEKIAASLASPLSIISSHAEPSRVIQDPRELFTTAARLSIPYEFIIEKYSLAPAKKFGIEKRGILKEGYYADIVVFSENRSVENVFVNGSLAVKNGIPTQDFGGVPLVLKTPHERKNKN
jgi:N-acyl-D-amino-acid deacylase